MQHNKIALFVHLVWATWDRLPLITADIERCLHRNIEDEAQRQGCTVLASGGTENHVHVLLSIPTTIAVATLVRQLKGVSSHFVNEILRPSAQFKWQGSYAAFSISRWDVTRLKGYINRQRERHQSGDLVEEFEQAFERIELAGDKGISGDVD